MKKVIAIGWALLCLATPADAVVVVAPAAASTTPVAAPAVRAAALETRQPGLRREPFLIALPAFLILAGIFNLNKPRSPRRVAA